MPGELLLEPALELLRLGIVRGRVGPALPGFQQIVVDPRTGRGDLETEHGHFPERPLVELAAHGGVDERPRLREGHPLSNPVRPPGYPGVEEPHRGPALFEL